MAKARPSSLGIPKPWVLATSQAAGPISMILKRGSMLLYLANCHLTHTRLFHDCGEFATAHRLLQPLHAKGYHRLDQELANAEATLG